MALPTVKNNKKPHLSGVVFLVVVLLISPNYVVAQSSTSLPQNFANTIFCAVNNLLGIKSCGQETIPSSSDLVAGVSFVPVDDKPPPQIIQHITQPVIERTIHTKEIIQQAEPENSSDGKVTEANLAHFGSQLDELSRTLYQSPASVYDDTALWRVIAQMNVSGVSSGASSDDQSLAFNSGTSILTISGGNSIDLSALSGSAGSDDQTLSAATYNASTKELSISIENGNTVTVDLSDLIDDADASVTNEIQSLSLSGDSLSITGTSTTIDLSTYLDDTILTELQVDAFVSDNGYLTSETDGSVLNEIQDLQISGNSLTITGNGAATTIDLSPYLDNTDTLNGLDCSSNEIAKWNGSAWVCSSDASGAGGTDDQTIDSFSLSANIISLSLEGDGEPVKTIDLTAYVNTDTQLNEIQVDSFVANNGYLTSETDGSITNEIQALAFSSNILSLSGTSTPIDLSVYLDDTDTTYTAGTGLLLTGTSFSSALGSSIDISDETNLAIPATGLEFSGDAIVLSSGFAIPLTASSTDWSTAFAWGDHSIQGYLDNTDDQTLSFATTTNILTVSGGNNIDLSDLQDNYSAGNGLNAANNEFVIDAPSCSGTDKLQWNGTSFICASDVDTDTQLNETQVDSFVSDNGYLTSETDDQTIDAFGLFGDTLSLSLEADGEAAKTVDLSTYAKDADLHDVITLSGAFDYLSLVGQDIVRGAIDLTSDITGTLSVGNGGTGATTTVLARSNLGLAIGANVQAFDSDTSLLGQTIETSEITNGTILGVDLDLTDITLSDFTNDQSFITDGNSNWDNSYGFLTDANDTVSGSELDGVFSATGLLTRTGVGTYGNLTDNSTNWNTAFGWGDHATGGYLTGIAGQSIKALSDVYSSMTPTDGQVLTFDTTNGWQAETLPDGADDLGNHTATQILNLNGNYLSGDGGAEGLFVVVSGNIGIGSITPTEKLTIDGNLAFVGAAKNIIINNTSAAWTIATSTSAAPLFKVDTNAGNELVTLGKSGSSVIIGDVGSATNLVFEESAIIHGQGDNTLTFGQAGDKVNFAVNVGIGAAIPAYPLHMGSGAFVSTGGSWTNASSRDLKENFLSLNPMDILTSINALDISQWNYKVEDSSVLHIGPIAQDFFAEFGLGGSDVSISTIDTAGVALIGIQALSQKFDDLFAGVSIAEDGALVVSNIETDNLKTKTFCIGSTCIAEDVLRDLLDLEPLSEDSNVENNPADIIDQEEETSSEDNVVDSTDPIEEISQEDEEEPLAVTATSTTPLSEDSDPIEQASSTIEQNIEQPSLDVSEQSSDTDPDDDGGETQQESPVEPLPEGSSQNQEPEIIEQTEPDISTENIAEQTAEQAQE